MIDLAALLADLCSVDPDRRPGSPGNQAAVDRVAATLAGLGWDVQLPEFPVVDWAGGTGTLTLAGRGWPVHPSPYATGWRGSAPVHPACDEAGLSADHSGAILLLHGELTAAPLTPTGYPFYGSPRDERVAAALVASGAAAVLAVTGRCPELAGAVEPFPLIEDGAFPLPTGNLAAADGAAVLAALEATPQQHAAVDLPARRWPATARNVVARRGPAADRVVVVAHIDSKPGTPGAVDNAAGVVVLVRVAELLAAGADRVELLAVNGEDYYAASGELAYLASTDLTEVGLAVNIDGAGYRGAPTAYSTYGLPAGADLSALAGLVPGPQWPQSDHMVFAAAGRPAVALTSRAVDEVLARVAHSPADTPDVVDPRLLEQAAQAVAALIRSRR